MKIIVLFQITEEKEQKAELITFANETATICITAPTLEEANELLLQSQKKLNDPEVDPEVDMQPEYNVPKIETCCIMKSIDGMEEKRKKYELEPAGARFLKTLENADKFYWKHSKGGMLCSQVEYLINKHHNSMASGWFDIAALSYRRGYFNGKEAGKERSC